ncbi:MAG: D-alanine--D-alanine ligase [Acetomicrobium sp.]|nr:D-alanine--D-alanine ligase [Acetomicrobium sp.]
MKVLVLYGGDSPEREVSFASGKAVLEAASRCGFDVLDGGVETVKDVVRLMNERDCDVIFIALHGSWGEDGRLQAFLDFYDIPYTGSGSEACMLAMNKVLSKYRFQRDGIPTPDGVEANLFQEGINGACKKILEYYDYFLNGGKMVIKPARCGSTLGVSVITSSSDVYEAVQLASSYDSLIIAERYISGKEITVAVWDDGKPQAFPVIEIVPKNSLYSYKAKYTPGNSAYFVPAQLEDSIAKKAQEAALMAHISLGCELYSRVDMRLDTQGNPYVLEVNTVPGLTSTSLVPKAAKAIGWDFDRFVKELIQNTLNKKL